MTIRSHSSHWLILTFVFLIAGCQNETPEPEQSESSFEKSAPMPVAEALDGQPEISISTLRKRLGADSRAEFTKASGRIVAANLARSGVTDLSPLEGLPLKYLDLTQLNIDSIAALKGMPLEELYLEGTQVSDLSPLAGMPLKILRTEQCPITDISPLQGMKLEQLGLFGTKVTDLSAIAGMPLNTLWLTETPVQDLSIVKQLSLESLDIEKSQISDLSPLAGHVSLKRLNIAGSAVSDLTPLKGLTLDRLIFTPENIKTGLDVVQAMPSLQQVGTSFETVMQPGLFWATLLPASSSDSQN